MVFVAESLFSILSNKDFDIPPEVAAVKAYIKRHFDMEVPVAIKDKNIVVQAPNSAMAGALRMHSYKIIEECNLSGRVLIRIGR